MKNCQRSQRNPSKIRPLIGPPVLQRLPMYLTKIHVPPIMTDIQSKLTNILKIFHKKSSLNVQWKSQHHIMSSRQEARAKERNTVLLTKQNRSGDGIPPITILDGPVVSKLSPTNCEIFSDQIRSCMVERLQPFISYQGPDLSFVMLYLPCSCWAFWQFEKTFQIRIF